MLVHTLLLEVSRMHARKRPENRNQGDAIGMQHIGIHSVNHSFLFSNHN